ncbi:helix-turn-helix transcriptional regulator [Enterococcus sp. MJM12]|uniref:Helix-turn-helix transcriptional regulator n=1 Tax=Candidatus Enterococcus myersii TaxID=2815322 RepID=A0ABS3H369_9ENTE|nr:helix-turn-helix transcriptional regulator [Enterococcus sp. MJM12]MBO0447913.1 helix-turn-helix transcriptional regulator [Enterococcus sp. MJM12]DAY50684.1 MAG TPA: helix-turn-helix domain protein [Caudoviricetes sp.]
MPQEQMMTLGALRKRMQMTQQQVAEQVGVTRETIMRWEKDSSDMPAKYMFVFSNLYRYPVNGIFFGDTIAFSDNLKSIEK